MSDVEVAEVAPVTRPGLLSLMLRFRLIRMVVAAIPLIVLMGVTECSIVSLGLVPGAMAGSLLAFCSGLVGLALYAGHVRWLERRRVAELGHRGLASELGSGVIVGIGLFVVAAGLLVLIGVGRIDHGDGLAALVPWLLWVVGTIVPEELLFRGVMFRIVEERLGSWIALVISAALFGGLHAVNANASVGSSVAVAVEAGVLLAAAYMASRRLWLPIGLHAGWNLAQLGLLGVRRPGHATQGVWSSRFTGPTLLSGGDWGPEISIVAVLACLAAAVALLALARRRGRIVQPLWARKSPDPAAQKPVWTGEPGLSA